MNTIKTSNLLLLAFAGALALAAGNALAADAVAKVNGKVIPQARLDFVMKMGGAQGQADTPEARSRARDVLVNQEILVQEAIKKGLDKNPDVTIQIELNKDQVLINAFLQDYVKNNPVSDDALKKEYDQQKSIAGDKEYKARHILVKTEDEAKQIVAQLKKGANFEKLAAQKSGDEGSKNRGGDLDWAAPARYVPQFGDALKRLKKGQLTDPPVQTQFGWHVIRMDDERPLKFPTFEEAKPQIQQNLQRQAVDKVVAELRAKAKVE